VKVAVNPLKIFLTIRMVVHGRVETLKVKISLLVKNYKMPRRTSINDVNDLTDLNNLETIVKDKRVAKRKDEKKNRRNRHYVKVLIKYQIKPSDSD
jgi:hypothetical protein